MTALVKIKVPKLKTDQKLLCRIIDDFFLAHSHQNDDTLEIMNKRKLGRSEKDLIQDIVDCLIQLMDAENN